MSAFSVLLLIGMAGADTFGNWTIRDWENTTGSQMGAVFGSGTYCFAGTGENCVGGVAVDMGSIFMGIFIMGFIFIWASVSGIAWDGVFFLMMIVLVILAQPNGGLLGLTAWAVFNFIWAMVLLALLYRLILRRG